MATALPAYRVTRVDPMEDAYETNRIAPLISASERCGPACAGPLTSAANSKSKADLCAQLHDARISRTGYLAESIGAKRSVQSGVVRMVESVERFHSKL